MNAIFADHRLAFRSLVTLQVFVAVTAITGGAMLMKNAGGAILFPLHMLKTTPFTTFMIPGLLLAFVVGVSAAMAAILLLRTGKAGAWTAGGASVILLVWITSEALLLDSFHPLQAFYAAVAAFEILLSWLMLSVDRRSLCG